MANYCRAVIKSLRGTTEVTGVGAKSFEGEKAWSTINHSIGSEENLL
jgi:hypothetical protein